MMAQLLKYRCIDKHHSRTKKLIMKKVVLGCAVLLSAAVVLATKDQKKNVAMKHSCTVTAINFASDTVPNRKDTTTKKKDTMMLAKY
jgi:hypothetical protein